MNWVNQRTTSDYRALIMTPKQAFEVLLNIPEPRRRSPSATPWSGGRDATRSESQFAFYLDEPALVTLGVCYDRFPRFGGGAYHSILRRPEAFTDEPLRTAFKDHEKRATMVLDLEEKVVAAVKKLKARGLVSPYLRSFVVARINPVRWSNKTMRERAAKFNVEKIRPQDLAGAAGPPDEEG
jgi:ParB family chromosome partitioning protein